MIKFLDLAKVNNRFRDEMDARIAKILDKGWYLQGEENEIFAKHFAEYCGAKYALGVANGLDGNWSLLPPLQERQSKSLHFL